jgi:hypothetical protein
LIIEDSRLLREIFESAKGVGEGAALTQAEQILEYVCPPEVTDNVTPWPPVVEKELLQLAYEPEQSPDHK